MNIDLFCIHKVSSSTFLSVPEGFHSTVVAHEDITKRPLIVQIFEGHGTAVFSLLHLVSNVTESDKQGNAVNSQSSSVLEVSSESLIDILSVVLKCLELKCQSSNIPELTPAFLLASKKVRVTLFSHYDWILKNKIAKVLLNMAATAIF